MLGDMAKNLRGGYCHGLKKKAAPFIIGVAGGTASGKVCLNNSLVKPHYTSRLPL